MRLEASPIDEAERLGLDGERGVPSWNHGSKMRVVLMMDAWNPHLTTAERDAVAVPVAAMGDFNRAAGL